MTVEFRQQQEKLAFSPELPLEQRLTATTQSAAERTALAFRVTPGPSTTQVQEGAVLNLAQRWHALMRSSLVPELKTGLEAQKTDVMNGLGEFPTTRDATITAMDFLIQKSEAFITNPSAQGFQLFFQVEQFGQSLEKTMRDGRPPIPQVLAPIRQFIENLYVRMQLERPAMLREEYRGRDVDRRAGNALRMLLVIGAAGGFATQGVIFAFAKNAEGERVMNPTAMVLYGSMLGMGLFGDRMLGIFRAPGTLRMEDSVRQMRFIGEDTFTKITSQNGIAGPEWAPIVRGLFSLRGDLNTNQAFTREQRDRILGLTANEGIKKRLIQMLVTRGGPQNEPGQPMREFIGLLYNARSPDAERAVIAYFEGRGTPDQVRQLMLTLDNPPPDAPAPVPPGTATV
jgi:hypothetical protein